MKNRTYTTTAASAARGGGSGSFAAGGGDASPGNSRLGQRPAGSEAEAVMMMNVGREHVGRRTLTGPEVSTSYVPAKRTSHVSRRRRIVHELRASVVC